jgi:predicted DNA binding CopG/RHH family protein
MTKRARPDSYPAGSEPGITADQIEAETSEREPYIFDDLVMEARAEEAITQADVELAARDRRKPNVNFRWESAPLDMVRLAAELAGVPYQTWMKQVLYEHAVQAIMAAREVDGRARKLANI